MKRHGEVPHPPLASDVEDADNVRVEEVGGEGSLPAEPRLQLDVADVVGRQDLQGDRVAAALGACGEDPGELPPTVHSVNQVWADPPAYELLGIQGRASSTLQERKGRLNLMSVIN